MKGDGKAAAALAAEFGGDAEPQSYAEAMVQPRIRQAAGVIKFSWDAEQVQVVATRMHQHRDGRVTAELKITTTAPGYPSHLHQAQLNLTATRSKKELAKHLIETRNDIMWETLIEDVSREILDRIRQGEPVLRLSTADDVEPLTYLVEPLIPEDEPTVIYGLGASGKSLFALICAMAIQLPWHDNPLRLNCQRRMGVLYLDWETSYKQITRRMKALQFGMEMPLVEIDYRRCALPLADDSEAIQKAILDNGIGFVVVDSIAAACGGDLNAAEPAIRMFTALRQMNVTSLLLAHTSKNPATKETTVYGSGYFNFYSRSVWEMKKQQEAGEKCFKAGLYHKKVNDTEMFHPLGFRFDFADGGTRISRMEIANVTELAQHLSVRSRITHALRKHGMLTVEALSELLGATKGTVRDKLYDMQKAGEVVKFDMKWGLAARENYSDV